MNPFSWLKWRLIEAFARWKRKRLEKKRGWLLGEKIAELDPNKHNLSELIDVSRETKFIDHGPSSRRKP